MLPFTRPTISQEEIDAVVEVLRSGWLATGPKVQRFEKELADYIGGGVEVRAFNSGTSALEAALLASDIGPGDEVIVPALSFVASANVVLRVGAKPVFVDVDLSSRNLDVEKVKGAMSEKTRGIIPVHFSGLPVDMEPIYKLSQENRITVIEDACHAIGSSYNGAMIGAAGNPACFSFHPNKNMTTIEGGALSCKDVAFMKRIERIRFHGIERNEQGEIFVSEWGGKMNLSDVSAAMGIVQLGKLDDFNRQRERLAHRYFEQLPDHPALVKPANGKGHSWHMFCVCIDGEAIGKSRQEIIDFFREHDIAVGMHYPAMHLFPLYRRLGYQAGDFPNAEQIGAQTLTLPLFPGMTDRDVDMVCETINSLLSSGK
ncbi:DegT/DnrJ/EryC1/StrS family aminotransferase [Microbulbifer hainanensis]|uniref:DegT/DnrJ/EryC1/StrS family aminotransferase n=1 Tax=Microbulbifer hainanensis TaxID=2735675 RepID=UPI0018688FC9|nr:DegT/DnrJ/EryC1/StrS family aminotransferase [Microbulbifer hainanensis]